jgi:predicted ribosome quality control (RQC) complex YloA/Tae2 family protein
MNNYYTLIYLNRELNGNIRDAKFDFAISPHKDVLECYIKIRKTEKRLVASTNPEEIALFLDDYRPPKKHNVLEFFSPLEGQRIVRISLEKHDRLLSVHFEDNRHLLFKLYGNDANILLVENDTIVDAFKHPEGIKGEPPPRPQTPNFADDITGKAKPKNELTKLNPLLPRNLLPPLIEQRAVGEMNVEEIKSFTQKITTALLNDPHPRVLKTGDLCLWSKELLNLPTEKSFDTVNDAIRFAYRNAVHLRRLHNKKERLSRFLERSVKKKQAQYEQLQQADKSLERADEYEKYGHLLMAHAHEAVQAGAESIQLKDIYENNIPIEIPLKKGKTIAQNAEHYYKKAKSSRSSYENAKKRIPKVKRQKKKLEILFDELQDIERLYNLDEWIKEHAAMLEKQGYGTEDEGQAESPFRKFKVGKYEIWVGKNAKSNDKLTSHAHKEDMWLHARGVGGSHTVIRMGNEKSMPPKKVILHAASYAAWYSKAKGMKTAPVMYTKRKYVYKPSGAAPGAVVVKQEEVVMVPPRKPE